VTLYHIYTLYTSLLTRITGFSVSITLDLAIATTLARSKRSPVDEVVRLKIATQVTMTVVSSRVLPLGRSRGSHVDLMVLSAFEYWCET
jgi:hypothetical protein